MAAGTMRARRDPLADLGRLAAPAPIAMPGGAAPMLRSPYRASAGSADAAATAPLPALPSGAAGPPPAAGPPHRQQRPRPRPRPAACEIRPRRPGWRASRRSQRRPCRPPPRSRWPRAPKPLDGGPVVEVIWLGEGPPPDLLPFVEAPPSARVVMAEPGPVRRRDPVEPPLLEQGEWREWLLSVVLNGQLVSDGALFIRDARGSVGGPGARSAGLARAPRPGSDHDLQRRGVLSARCAAGARAALRRRER